MIKPDAGKADTPDLLTIRLSTRAREGATMSDSTAVSNGAEKLDTRKANTEPLDLTRVLVEEISELHGIKDPVGPERDGAISEESVWSAIHGIGEERAALCLSGGGIRSATFSLGFLQGLARKGVLTRFHYLSTVSGGGYIGSWLSAWISRDGVKLVCDKLAAEGNEAAPIQKLRAYSNYLAPRRGLSTDFLTIAGITARNLFLNWCVLIPLLVAALAIPRLYVALAPGEQFPAIGWLAVGLYAGAWFAIARFVHVVWQVAPSWQQPITTPLQPAQPPSSQAPGWSLIGFWFLVPLAALLLALAREHAQATLPAWISALGNEHARAFILAWISEFAMGHPFGSSIAAGALFGFTSCLAGVVWVKFQQRTAAIGRALLLAGAGGALAGAGFGAIAAALPYAHSMSNSERSSEPLFALLAPPALLGAYWVGTSLLIGIFSRKASEEAREWWARGAAVILGATLIWLGVGALFLYGPTLMAWIAQEAGAKAVALGGISGLVSALIGLWGKGGIEEPSEEDTRLRARFGRFLMPCAASAFLVLFAILLVLGSSALLHQERFRDESKSAPPRFALSLSDPGTEDDRTALTLALAKMSEAHFDAVKKEHPGAGLLLLLGAATLGLVMAWWIGVNRFSLHSMYGNRLVRAYLGASNVYRTADRFTDFDPSDNLQLGGFGKDQWSFDGKRCLFHVTNVALNLTRGPLQWQQRQAASYTVSPLHSGSAVTGFQPSASYGGAQGMSLGKAMTISGAAVSPAMGYHSSRPVSWVMTLLNTRLGWWLPNPGEPGRGKWQKSEPTFGLHHLWKELISSTTSGSSFVYLSDGGHFDNLGLYEMVRRRCKKIVVVDASCDSRFTYEDLSRCVRMIRADFGIEVEFQELPRAANGSSGENGGQQPLRRYALGRVRYSRVDGAGSSDGVILYVKPILLGDEPLDVQGFARMRSSEGARFPHDSTTDQFFDEAQFESYRRLGIHSANALHDDDRKLFDEAGSTLAETVRGGAQPILPINGNIDRAARANGSGGSSWSQLLASAPAWVAPAVISTAAAVTVTGAVDLSAGPLKFEELPPLKLDASSTVHLDAGSVRLDTEGLTLPVEPISPVSVVAPEDGLLVRLDSDDTTFTLDPQDRQRLNEGLRIAPADLAKIAQLQAAIAKVNISTASLAEMHKHVTKIDETLDRINATLDERVAQGEE